MYFNPRSPRGLRPVLHFAPFCFGYKFQSTQPKRAATIPAAALRFGAINFNPRSPRGLRLKEQFPECFEGGISIHAAQEGCDTYLPGRVCYFIHFNPRSPRGLRHFMPGLQKQAASNFNPRSPRGLRQCRRSLFEVLRVKFQSTQPKRAATHAPFQKVRQPAHFNPRSPRGLRHKC